MYVESKDIEAPHKCNLPMNEDIVVKYIDSGCFVNIRRKFRRFLTVSEFNKRSYRALKSAAAIREEKNRHLSQAYHMIHPYSDAKLRWEEVMVAVYLVLFMLIPFRVVLPVPPWHIRIPKIILDFFCLCDIVLWFFFGHCNIRTNKVTLNRRSVAKNYLKTYFLIDCFSTIPDFIINIAYTGVSEKYDGLRYLCYLKVLRMNTFIKYLEKLGFQRYEPTSILYKWFLLSMLTQFSGDVKTHPKIRNLFKQSYTKSLLLFFNDFLIYVFKRQHWNIYTFKITKWTIIFFTLLLWTTSFYHLVIKNEISSNSSEVHTLLASCLGSVSNILLIGPGLHSLQEVESIVYVLLSMIIGVFLDMFIYAQALHMIETNLSLNNKYQDLLQQLREFMRYKKLPDTIKKRVLQFINFKFERSYFKESEVVDTLSENLRQDVFINICQNLVEKVEFLYDVPYSLLTRIVKCMKSEIFLCGDVIIKAGTAGDCMYFISSGTVAVYTEAGKELCHLYDGSHFGEAALVLDNERRIASVVAIECCDIYILSRKDFQKAVEPYPDLRHNMTVFVTKRLLMSHHGIHKS